MTKRKATPAKRTPVRAPKPKPRARVAPPPPIMQPPVEAPRLPVAPPLLPPAPIVPVPVPPATPRPPLPPLPPLHVRLEQAKAHPKITAFRYMDPDGTTRCKCCGTAVAGWRPVADPVTTETQDSGRTRLQQVPMGIGALGPYAMLVLTMDDGGQHESPCCRGCEAEILADPSLWEAWYAADIARIAESGPKSGLTPIELARVMAMLSGRRPVAARVVHLGQG